VRSWFRPRLERLENRALPSGTTPFPEPFTPVAPLGSLIYESAVVPGSIQSPGDTASYTLSLNTNENVTVIVRPTHASGNPLQPSITVLTPFAGSFTLFSSGPGAPVMNGCQLSPDSQGPYTFTVAGMNGSTGDFTIQAFLNAEQDAAVIDLENSTLATAQELDFFFIPLVITGATQSVQIAAVARFE